MTPPGPKVFERYEQRKARLAGEAPKRRKSTIQIPRHANPFARILFEEMSRQAITYDELAERSGVLRATAKAWRSKNAPGLAPLAACLAVVGMTFVAVPNVERLDPDLRRDLERLAELHGAKVDHLVAHLIETSALSEAISEDSKDRVALWRARAAVETEARHKANAAREARLATEREMAAAA